MAILTATCVLLGIVINGTINFSYDNEARETKVTGNLMTNLGETTKHGFHVHTSGNMTTCKTTGGHYNPHGKLHGGPTDTARHAGDLGNVMVGSGGAIKLNIADKQIPLDGEFSVVNRAIVIHAGEDDLGKGNETDSTTTGHAGSRLNCCKIELKEESSGYMITVSKSTVLASILLAVTWTAKFVF